MKKLILGLLLIISFNALSQTLNEELIGNWKVVKISDNNDNLPEPIKMMQKAIAQSTFKFSADKKFSFLTPVEDLKINDGHWKIKPGTNTILIQEWADKDKEKPLLMSITVSKNDNKIYFMIEESFFTFEMQKT